MRFQKRDGAIVSTIYEYDGVLARRHLTAMFWPDTTLRAAQKRLAKLIDDGYLVRPTLHQRKTQPIPEPIYWLGWRGILWAAAQQGIEVDPPANHGENQLRKLRNRLLEHDIHWLREPRWIQLAHDLAVVDFRLTVTQATKGIATLHLEEWIHESRFRSDGDSTEYFVPGPRGEETRARKRVYPDSYFVVVDTQREAQGEMSLARFLLELDNATHSNSRFGREKVVPGIAYINSEAYKTRFGDNSGRWLVVTTGKIRMKNLMRQAKQVAENGADTLLFTTSDHLQAGNILTEPVWQQVGRSGTVSLFPRHRHGDGRASLNGEA